MSRYATLVNPARRKRKISLTGETLRQFREDFERSGDQAYKGYRILYNAFEGMYFISKGGYHISSARTLKEAKAMIDEIADVRTNPSKIKDPFAARIDALFAEEEKTALRDPVVRAELAKIKRLTRKVAQESRDFHRKMAKEQKLVETRRKALKTNPVSRKTVKPLAAWIFKTLKEAGKANTALIEHAIVDYQFHKTKAGKAKRARAYPHFIY